ncbi:hypothetical protein N7478_011135 [Penicillium angulare]|uniref:uncharacterized protein n=1 Tax=Penicillium angulare TaxID=116970 RepID=UPI002540685D|nr:uncharacterized protein N7478_011135 [Penicillium angulare]KAJ5263530.1 hypothetical protein N7478_011135 [Penicillium angulare]
MYLVRLATGVAAATMVVTAVADSQSTTSTTALTFVYNNPSQHMLGASIVTANSSETIAYVNCKSNYTSECSSQGWALPLTVEFGGSTRDVTSDITSYYGKTLFLIYGSELCTFHSSSSSLHCTRSYNSLVTTGALSTSTSSSGAYWYAGFTFATIDVTAGLENIAHAATTTSDASPASTATTTSAPKTTTATATDGSASSSSSSSSSFKAWIAGAVIGAVVGISFIIALAYWQLRRKRKGAADAQGLDTARGRNGVVSELFQEHAREMDGSGGLTELHGDIKPTEHAQEMDGRGRATELHGDFEPTELTPDTARVEFPVDQPVDHTKLDEKDENIVEQSTISELP